MEDQFGGQAGKTQKGMATVLLLLGAGLALIIGVVAGVAVGLNISQEATRKIGQDRGHEEGYTSGQMVGHLAGYSSGLSDGKESMKRELTAEYERRWDEQAAVAEKECRSDKALAVQWAKGQLENELKSAKKNAAKERTARGRASEKHAKKLEAVQDDRDSLYRQFSECEQRLQDAVEDLKFEKSENHNLRGDRGAALNDVRQRGYDEGYTKGNAEGYKSGYRVGYGEGYKKAGGR